MSEKYRKGVGIFLINKNNRLWVGQRLDHKNQYWQMPQGGIDSPETPEDAMKRELMEETGLDHNYEIIGKSSSWLKYNIPSDLVNILWKGKYKGQEQIWFACRFFGKDEQVNLERYSKPEFYKWKWINPIDVIKFAVPFKKKLYGSVLNEFRRFLD